VNGADWHDVTVTICVITVLAAAFVIAGGALGWLEGSLSLKFVPPWKRKASEPKASARPAEAPANGPVQLSDRKAG
jgi:hypothetical protein